MSQENNNIVISLFDGNQAAEEDSGTFSYNEEGEQEDVEMQPDV